MEFDADGEALRLQVLRQAREAQSAARIAHPGVIKKYDVVEDGPYPWIVMEYVPGRDLNKLLVAEGWLTPEQVARIGLQILDALRATHAAGVVHRDVKPQNIILDGDRAVLADFGIASIADLTRITHFPIATAAYAAREQVIDNQA